MLKDVVFAPFQYPAVSSALLLPTVTAGCATWGGWLSWAAGCGASVDWSAAGAVVVSPAAGVAGSSVGVAVSVPVATGSTVADVVGSMITVPSPVSEPALGSGVGLVSVTGVVSCVVWSGA